jgi:hypothetical protein
MTPLLFGLLMGDPANVFVVWKTNIPMPNEVRMHLTVSQNWIFMRLRLTFPENVAHDLREGPEFSRTIASITALSRAY